MDKIRKITRIIVIIIIMIIFIITVFYYKDTKENQKYVSLYTAQNQFPAQITEKKENLTEVRQLKSTKDIYYIDISQNTVIEKNGEKISYDELKVGDKIVVYFADEAIRAVYPTTLYEITKIEVLGYSLE